MEVVTGYAGAASPMTGSGEPALSVLTAAGLAGLGLLIILLLFVLAMYIDCRQQRLDEKNKSESKRLRCRARALKRRREDELSIASNMEPPEPTLAPVNIV